MGPCAWTKHTIATHGEATRQQQTLYEAANLETNSSSLRLSQTVASGPSPLRSTPQNKTKKLRALAGKQSNTKAAADLGDPVGRAVGDPHHSVVVLHPLVKELPHPPPPVRGEEEASLRVELLDGADEAHRGVLLEIRLGEATVREGAYVVLHDDVHQAEVAQDCSPRLRFFGQSR